MEWHSSGGQFITDGNPDGDADGDSDGNPDGNVGDKQARNADQEET
jgi:hypothetical protein